MSEWTEYVVGLRPGGLSPEHYALLNEASVVPERFEWQVRHFGTDTPEWQPLTWPLFSWPGYARLYDLRFRRKKTPAPKRCSSCRGEGYLTRRVFCGRALTYGTIVDTCPTCGGSGDVKKTPPPTL